MDKVIVITGSTRGIGFGLAKSFLDYGCKVVISARKQETVVSTVASLAAKYDHSRIFGVACDVTNEDQVDTLWEKAIHQYDKVDIWINNAGIAHRLKSPWEISGEESRQIVETNILGTLNGSRIAIKGMMEQKFGALYNMEGFGSTGSLMAGLSIYGMTKYAVNYLNRSLIREIRGSDLIVGIIRPGMVATDLITNQYAGAEEDFEQVKPILSILSQRVETVCPVLVQAMLKNKKNGKVIRGSSSFAIFFRFISAPFVKRKIFDV